MVGRSAAEDLIKKFWEEFLKNDFISINHLLELQDKFSRLLMKCEELRKSRDKWRVRAENAEKEIRHLQTMGNS